MRIAQVVTYISSDGAFGGPVAVALAQSIELASQGHTVDLYAAWDGKVRISAPGVTLKLFKVNRAARLSNTMSVGLVGALWRHRNQYDAVHLHFARDLISLASSIVLRRRRDHLVLQPHGMIMPDKRPQARLVDTIVVRPALRSASAVLALTESEAQGLLRVGALKSRLKMIDNGIDIPSGTTHQRSSPPIVLFLGRLHPRKNVLLFAEVARRAREQGLPARFRVVGPDEGDLPALRAFITNHNLETVLEYAGAVGPGQGAQELRAATVFVLPSIAEVYPMTVLEALANGTPAVVSEDCGLAPLLREAKAARLASADADSVSAAVMYLLANPEERRAQVERGLDLARSKFALDGIAAQLTAAYSGRSAAAPPIDRAG